jgi:hypothetical protein
MLILKEFFEYLNSSNLGVKKKVANKPISQFSRTQYSNIPVFSPRRRRCLLYEPEANIPIVSVRNG